MTVRTASFTLAALDLFPRRGHFGCPQDTPAWSTFPGSKRAVISVKSRNIAARPVAVVNALGYRTTTVYDAAAQKIAIVNANGGRYTFTIDPAGRTTRETDPLGRMTTLSYDNAGRQTAKLDARGVRTTFLWDNADRLVGRRYTNDPAVTFAYDDAGNRTLAQDTLGPLTFTYDALNRLRQVDGVANKTISYSYDPRGLRATMTDPDGGVTTYSHDPAGRLEYLINPQAERTTLSYDADNRQTLKHLANGARTSVTYDAANRVTQLYHLKSDQSVLEGFNYGYDAVANRTTAQEANGDQVTWSYDPTYQLINEQRSGPAALGWVPLTLDQWSQMSLDQWAGMRLEPGAYFNLTHTYDPVGNRLVQVKDGARTTFSYDPANQLETSVDSSGTTTYTFDQAGNQQLVVAPGNARTTSVWNDENRQVRLLLPDGKITTSTYSFDGLRRSKRDSSGVTYYIFDGQNYLQETDGAGVTKAQFTNTLDQFGRLVSQSRKSGGVWTPSYYLFDAVGSTRLLLAADQSPSDTYWYEAFGNLLASTGETVNPFRYIGELGYYFDADSGNYYVREREYRPVIIIWLSIDPLGFDAGDDNVYRYVKNNPINAIDPNGLKKTCYTQFVGFDFSCLTECIVECANPIIPGPNLLSCAEVCQVCALTKIPHVCVACAACVAVMAGPCLPKCTIYDEVCIEILPCEYVSLRQINAREFECRYKCPDGSWKSRPIANLGGGADAYRQMVRKCKEKQVNLEKITRTRLQSR